MIIRTWYPVATNVRWKLEPSACHHNVKGRIFRWHHGFLLEEMTTGGREEPNYTTERSHWHSRVPIVKHGTTSFNLAAAPFLHRAITVS